MAFLPPAVPYADVRTLALPEPSGDADVRSALGRGRRAFGSGRYAEASAIYAAILPAHRQCVPAYIGLAWSAMARQQYGMAYSPLQEGLRLRPGFALGWREFGRDLYFLKRYDRAVLACRKAIARDPKDGQAWLIEGLAQAMGPRPANALPALEKAERLLPDDPLPWRIEGKVLLATGQTEAGGQVIDEALRRAPADPQLHAMKREALKAQGHYFRAAWLWLSSLRGATH